jgi:ribosomal protein RSM22 (predicted rRNA methylase)
LILVEPGTPRGFSCIRNARDQILSLGGTILAPCPHGLACPLKANDWCHFSVRIPRSRLHRYLKAGSLGYEDEKYSYLIASKKPFSLPRPCRILRHPQKQSGHVRLSLCTSSGSAEETTVTRSNQEFYRKARDAFWGGTWEM